MPRRPRQDHAGAWHHIYSRGIARRTIVETRRDARVLLCLLAREVRCGTLEVHAFALMTTHVHLLVRSLQGRVSHALKRVFNGYVRWFNRSRKRDGSLFRGRFGSRLLTGDVDRLNVIAYIDANPVEAQLAATPEAYPYGSAHLWAKGRAPRWLATGYVAEILGVEGPQDVRAWGVYCREFAPRGSSACARLIEARLACGSNEPDPLDDLVGAAPSRVYEWMVRKAALADQTRPGIPVVDVETVDAAWRAGQVRIVGEVRGRRGPGRARSVLARVALLRDLAGLRYQAIATRLGSSPTEARTRYLLHRERVTCDAAYAAGIASIAHTALVAAHPATRPRPRDQETSQL